MSIGSRLENIASVKNGNKEMAIFFEPSGGWYIFLGNPCTSVSLGESCGEIATNSHFLLEDAVTELEQVVRGQ